MMMYKFLLLLSDFDTSGSLNLVTWLTSMANKFIVAIKRLVSYIRYFINNILAVSDSIDRVSSSIRDGIRSNVIRVDTMDADSISFPLNNIFGMVRYVVGDVIYTEMYCILIVGEAFLVFQIIRRIIDIIDYMKSILINKDLHIQNDTRGLKKLLHFFGS